MNWLVYGATGYTGRLVVEEAVRRGHRPVLAGRSAEKLRSMAEEFGLDYAACDLRDSTRLARTVADFDLVCHLAGPYVHTYEHMVQACLAGGASYLDITGEIPVLLNIEAYAREAEERGLALIPAAGFVCTPVDCCARFVAERLSNPVLLETALAPSAKLSAGTAKSILPILAEGALTRRGGRLLPQPLGRGARTVTFLDRARRVVPAPQAEVVIAHRTTGIPDITAYVAVPQLAAPVMKMLGPLAQRALSPARTQKFLRAVIERVVHGPSEKQRARDRSYIWVRAVDATGAEAEVRLETLGSYPFTAHAVVRAAERILSERPTGLLTPAQAFGADFVLEIPGTVRKDALA